METTIVGYLGIMGYILGVLGDNGKEKGNYYNRDISGYTGAIWGCIGAR